MAPLVDAVEKQYPLVVTMMDKLAELELKHGHEDENGHRHVRIPLTEELFITVNLSTQLDKLEEHWLEYMRAIDPKDHHNAFLSMCAANPLERSRHDQHDVVLALITRTELKLDHYFKKHGRSYLVPAREQNGAPILETRKQFSMRLVEHRNARDAFSKICSESEHFSMQTNYELTFHLLVLPVVKHAKHALEHLEDHEDGLERTLPPSASPEHARRSKMCLHATMAACSSSARFKASLQTYVARNAQVANEEWYKKLKKESDSASADTATLVKGLSGRGVAHRP